MSKILKKVLFTLLLVLLCPLTKISAASIVCDYPDLELTMTWDLEKEFDPKKNPVVKMGGYETSDSYFQIPFLFKAGKKVNLTEEAEIDQKLFEQVLDNYGCNDKMKVCVYTHVSLDLTWSGLTSNIIKTVIEWSWDDIESMGEWTQTLLILTEEEYKNGKYSQFEGGLFGVAGSDDITIRWEDGYDFGDVFGTLWDVFENTTGIGEGDFVRYREANCKTANYDGPYIGVNINCGKLKGKSLEYMLLITDYQSCGDDVSCKSKTISKINEKEEVIKGYCSQILQSYDYTDGQKGCIDECMKIKDTLNEYKAGTDLYDDGSNRGDCGFSARLLAWVSNVLRWIKYLLPVVVIVLGILDFIKAIASGKDDEMKKAQGSFIRRLIAAALVFIIPLIIEFVLDKMGFGYDTCGLF